MHYCPIQCVTKLLGLLIEKREFIQKKIDDFRTIVVATVDILCFKESFHVFIVQMLERRGGGGGSGEEI